MRVEEYPEAFQGSGGAGLHLDGQRLSLECAHAYALVLCLVSLASLMALFLLNRRIRHPV